MPYAILEKDKYDETIAHEVCHAFQFRLDRSSHKHGELFRFLFNTVCGFKRDRYHDYNVYKAKEIARILKLQEKLQCDK